MRPLTAVLWSPIRDVIDVLDHPESVVEDMFMRNHSQPPGGGTRPGGALSPRKFASCPRRPSIGTTSNIAATADATSSDRPFGQSIDRLTLAADGPYGGLSSNGAIRPVTRIGAGS